MGETFRLYDIHVPLASLKIVDHYLMIQMLRVYSFLTDSSPKAAVPQLFLLQNWLTGLLVFPMRNKHGNWITLTNAFIYTGSLWCSWGTCTVCWLSVLSVPASLTLPYTYVVIKSNSKFISLQYYICDRIWEKGPYRTKHDFLPLFKLPPFQGLKSPRLPTWFVGSLGLLLHRSNVRSYSKPPVLSSEPPKWGIKRRFSNAIDACVRPAHTGSGRGSQRVASIAGWYKNIHAQF